MLASGFLVTSAASVYVGYKVYKSVAASRSSSSNISSSGSNSLRSGGGFAASKR